MKPSTNPKFFDVTLPSQINPSSTSRPIIVGHRPMMVDPMVRGMQDPPQPAPHPAPPSHVAKVIDISDDVKKDLSAPEFQLPAPVISTLAPGVATGIGEVDPGHTVAPAEPNPTGVPQQSEQPLGSVAPPVSTQQPHFQTAPAPDLSHLQHIPVSHRPMSSARKLKSFLIWSFVLIFLVGFATYLAIDAGFINSNIKLPVHIFSRQI